MVKVQKQSGVVMINLFMLLIGAFRCYKGFPVLYVTVLGVKKKKKQSLSLASGYEGGGQFIQLSFVVSRSYRYVRDVGGLIAVIISTGYVIK